jgi:chemotaxis response regulator CheB
MARVTLTQRVDELTTEFSQVKKEVVAIGGRLDKMDLNGHTENLRKLAEAAPVLIDKVTKAHEDEVFWEGLKKRLGWLPLGRSNFVKLVGFASTLGWAILASVNIWKLLHH